MWWPCFDESISPLQSVHSIHSYYDLVPILRSLWPATGKRDFGSNDYERTKEIAEFRGFKQSASMAHAWNGFSLPSLSFSDSWLRVTKTLGTRLLLLLKARFTFLCMWKLQLWGEHEVFIFLFSYYVTCSLGSISAVFSLSAPRPLVLNRAYMQPRSQGPLSSSLKKVPWLRLVTCLSRSIQIHVVQKSPTINCSRRQWLTPGF